MTNQRDNIIQLPSRSGFTGCWANKINDITLFSHVKITPARREMMRAAARAGGTIFATGPANYPVATALVRAGLMQQAIDGVARFSLTPGGRAYVETAEMMGWE